MNKLVNRIPEYLKEPLRTILKRPHPHGLPESERRRLKKMPRFVDTSVSLFEKNFRLCDAASFLYSHDEIFNNKIYYFNTDSTGPIIFDIGANVGLAVLYFSRLHPGAKIVSIESDKSIFGILRENVSRYAIKNVEIHYGAAWADNTALNFATDHADGGRLADNGGEVVPGIRLRDLLLDYDQIEMLKIDIEGAEMTVLHDCRDVLSKVKRMFVEYHSFVDKPQNLSKLLAILEENGFRYYLEHTGVHSSYPLVERNSEAGYDLQLNIFATR